LQNLSKKTSTPQGRRKILRPYFLPIKTLTVDIKDERKNEDTYKRLIWGKS